MSPKRYPLVIEKTGTGYSAYSPDVPGCAAAGDTEEETRRNFQDALVAHVDVVADLDVLGMEHEHARLEDHVGSATREIRR